MIKKFGVESFNVGWYLPPMDGSDWELPVIARIVDRGKLSSRTTDYGGMEIYAGDIVIGSDPYRIIEKI